ncbi:condensin-2 complex subunit G2 [Calliopsis andreniformis]|uniref:condensin-2 complex subunit G2 n=1 Tax=Calliopsis andreniformis TaxID=337506 RepID=UPI003FCCE9D3
MSNQRGLPKDKILFRILKNKSPSASSLCEKLNHNVKNIVVLSEDELCELWQYMKAILLEAQKLYTQTSNNKGRYVKEHSLMIKLIRTITAMALETILQRIFIPNILLQNIMLLHTVILPNIKDKQATDEISYVLENWWKLDMTWREKVVTNALKYLIESCKSSLQHIKRLYDIKSSVKLLKCEDVQELFKLVREKTVMSLEEGRLLILHLFTLGEQYILGIHNNVKVVLQNVGHTYVSVYADLYISAWLAVTEKLKKFIVENCFQNIVFHCFRANRDSTGRGKLGKNLLSFLAAIHNSKNQAARLMIHNQCKSLLWKHVKAPGSYIRCNAVEILFMTSSVSYMNATKDRNNAYIQKMYKTISSLLTDSSYEVCDITINGLFIMLEKHWSHVPKDIIYDWLNIFLNYTKTSNNSQLRANVFIGLKKILAKDRSHKIIKDFLSNFAHSIYDEDNVVLEALIKLLWHAQTQIGIPFWNIVPLTYILDRLETTQDAILLQELIKLMWLRISLNDEESHKMVEEMVDLGRNNINAIRRFCIHSEHIINLEVSVKLIETILSIMKDEMECFPLAKISEKKCSKKVKLGNKENENICDQEVEDLDNYKDMQIYIDIIAMLLVANTKNISKKNLNEKDTNILQKIANVFPEFLKYFKETSINESMIFLFSLIPLKFFLDKIEVIEILVQQLCDSNTSDDVLLTIIYVLMKWNKGQTILFALSNLFTESLNINTQNNQIQSSCNDSDVLRINEKGLELSLSILKHLLHVEHQSVLMNKYHQDMLKFWEALHIWRTFIEKGLENQHSISSLISKDIVMKFFNEYISILHLLHKEDVFDASEHFSEILSWVKKTLVSHIPRTDTDTENHQICISLIKCTFNVSNTLLEKCNITPKLCCDIVLLYCNCLSLSEGTVFLNNAFDAIIKLLDFSKMAYENEEPNLLDIVVPNFVCVMMITLTKCNQDTLAKNTNNLKILHEMTQKYFSTIKCTFNDQRMCLPYITIMFNTAISSISTEMTCVLQNALITDKSILTPNLPYLAKKILKIILDTKKYQKLSVQVLTKTVTSYTRIDMLSALVIIHKMLKSSDKTVVNRLKNITLATRVHNQKQSCDTAFDR